MILLNPGPVTLSQRVRRALTKPDLCHREREFFQLQSSIRERIPAVYELPASYAAVLISGSGTAAVEAMLSTLIPTDGKVLIIENGVYGERLTRIAKIYQIDHAILHHAWGASIDLPALRHALRSDGGITHIALVHHETTTGRLNNLADIADICGDRVGLLIDAVSSFGAEPIDFPGWNIGAAAATANKCLHGAPGVSFVVLCRALLADAPKRNLYLDLANYCQHQDRESTPFTPSIPCFYALEEALKELEDQGGRPARYRRYRESMALVLRSLDALGIEPLLRTEESSVVLNAFRLPPGVSYDTLHDGLKEQGFVIYAGQGSLAESIFRVSVMGEIARTELERFTDAMRQMLRR
ncbi:MAG: 2-aminoethylphosphonate aminotransferase [Gammaproteobacteria bacterium]